MLKFYYINKIFYINNLEIKKNSIGVLKDKNNNKIKIYFINYNITCDIDKNSLSEIKIDKTGDQFQNKICDRCFRYLPSTFFSNNRIKKNAITKRPSCKDCRKIKDGVSISNSDRSLWISKKPKDFTLFECPICKKTTISGISKIVLDHNHHNGKVRGYLCESCNTGIGRFDDDPQIVQNAINWLKNKN